MSSFPARIAEQIWADKYQFKEADGTPIDVTVEDTWRRIAKALASAEKPEDQAHFEQQFYAALEGFKFLPAGRIISGAGTGRTVTLQNCLSADTMLLTKEYGLAPIGLLAGEHVHVLDGNGEWVPSPINSFDEQEVVEVELALVSQSRVKTTVRATKNHRWILSDGSERTTATLKHGDLLKSVARRKVDDSLQYREGLRHGIVYGDGNQRILGEGSLRLCGEKSCFAYLFEMVESGWRRLSDIDGDPNFYLPRDSGRSHKTLPGTDSVDYLTGFMRGWLATDGSVCKREGKALISCGSEELEWLKTYGPIVGFEVAYASKLPDETNYGKRNKEIFNATLRRHLLTEDDILRPSHREKFQTLRPVWYVKGVADSGNVEPVFCPSVNTTASMEISNGVHTGNCYGLGTIPDSMAGIFDALKDAALTMQQGGGIGDDFSTIRPKGALVKGVGSDASGPLSFMDCWDSMCRTVMSAGSRRGAMMATMRCDHPDIEAFIEAKQDPARLRMFNMSVLVTDAFMQAVKDDADWRLHFENHSGETLAEKTVRARDLWDKIMRTTYDCAEPGVIFIDRINAMNPLNYCETISVTNPCGEQPLPPYGACLLGSINLAALIKHPFDSKVARLDSKALKELVRTAVRMLDNVIEVTNYPLPQQAEESKNKRRIGLGVTGVADALLMLGITYGSDEAAIWVDAITKAIASEAYLASAALAAEKGPFPLFDEDAYLKHPYIQQFDENVRVAISKHGLRNSHLTSIAPTGTISLYAGNISSGIEPVFAYHYTRKVLEKDGSKREEQVEDYAYARFREWYAKQPEPHGYPAPRFDEIELPDYFVSAQTLPPEAHVKMQAAAQKWVDSSISKTVNLPEDISFEDFKAVYLMAYEMGCKGCTTYRPNDVTGSVLSVEPKKETIEVEPGGPLSEPDLPPPLAERPEHLMGCTYKLKWPGSEHAIYVTINDDEHGNPFEVFINSKDTEHFSWTVALTRMISAVFRRGGDVRFVAEELKAVFDPRGGAWLGGKYIPSVLAAIGGIIERHMDDKRLQVHVGGVIRNGTIDRETAKAELFGGRDFQSLNAPFTLIIPKGKQCPKCSSFNTKNEAGCFQCLDCDHSKCG